MRAPCKYAHDVTYLRWVDDALVDVTVDECWGEKEPSVCDARRKEYCDRYKPKDVINAKLPWIPTDEFDDYFGYVFKCARCGKEILRRANYCPHCGYEYKAWDGTTFK